LIMDRASVAAQGGFGGAGIGGGSQGHGGDIGIFYNAIVEASGFGGGAGIGGGSRGNGGNVAIGDSISPANHTPYVTATGHGSAGIGAGLKGRRSSGVIRICGMSTVHASGEFASLGSVVILSSSLSAGYNNYVSDTYGTGAGIDARGGSLLIADDVHVVAQGGNSEAGIDFSGGEFTVIGSPTIIAYQSAGFTFKCQDREEYFVGGSSDSYTSYYTHTGEAGKEVKGSSLYIAGGNVQVGDLDSVLTVAYGPPAKWVDLRIVSATTGKALSGVRITVDGDGKNWGAKYYASSDANGKVRMWLPERFGGYHYMTLEVEGYGLYAESALMSKPPVNQYVTSGMEQEHELTMSRLYVVRVETMGGDREYADYYVLSGDSFHTSYLSDLKRSGYSLVGWNVLRRGITRSETAAVGAVVSKITSNIQLVAQWKRDGREGLTQEPSYYLPTRR